MAHDVFISYATEDRRVAETVCRALEDEGIRCWYAPRDVVFGFDYEDAIIDAISDSRLVLLIVSPHSNNSPHVRREIQNACAEESSKPVLPVRVEDVSLNKALRYYLSSANWFDALTTPVESHLPRLVEQLRARLGLGAAAGAAGAASAPPVENARTPTRPAPESRAAEVVGRAAEDAAEGEGANYTAFGKPRPSAHAAPLRGDVEEGDAWGERFTRAFYYVLRGNVWVQLFLLLTNSLMFLAAGVVVVSNRIRHRSLLEPFAPPGLSTIATVVLVFLFFEGVTAYIYLIRRRTGRLRTGEKFFPLFLALAMAGVLVGWNNYATSAGLVGEVRNKSGGYVAGAVVTLRDEHDYLVKETATDDYGRYSLTGLTPGRYLVVVTSSVCSPYKEYVSVDSKYIVRHDDIECDGFPK